MEIKSLTIETTDGRSVTVSTNKAVKISVTPARSVKAQRGIFTQFTTTIELVDLVLFSDILAIVGREGDS